MAVAIRIIPMAIPTFEALALPPVFEQLANLAQGLVLVTGPTGSGKSTTLAALINRINETRPGVILTIEDPIEYVHTHQRAAVLQREIGQDTPSFDRALRAALREDPDVLLVGEMRDAESVGIAMTMAETGHLVLSTLHTNDAAQTVDRIIDVFPLGREEVGRTQLAASLAAVVSQRLVKRAGGGLVAAYEILLATPPVRNLIREGRSNQISNVLRTGQREGMCTLEASLAALVAGGVVHLADALAVANRPDEVTAILRQQGGARPT
jgi:twitching motility protein PilT